MNVVGERLILHWGAASYCRDVGKGWAQTYKPHRGEGRRETIGGNTSQTSGEEKNNDLLKSEIGG